MASPRGFAIRSAVHAEGVAGTGQPVTDGRITGEPTTHSSIVESLCRRYADIGRAVWGRERATRRSTSRPGGPATERAVGYARVFSPEDAASYSLEEQRRVIARYCEQRGYDLVRIDMDTGERPTVRGALLADLPGNVFDFDFVVVAALDRWLWDDAVHAGLVPLGDADIGFASVEEGIDFTLPTARLVLRYLWAADLSPTADAMSLPKARERVARGITPGPVPFGYRKSPSGRPLLVPEEGEAILEAFRRRARGESYGAIARWLNGQGLRPPGPRGSFTPDTVGKLLANVFYRGAIRYRGREHPGSHEPLVDPDLFRQVQARRGATRRGASRPRWPTSEAPGLLRGLAVCWRCGIELQCDRTEEGRYVYRDRGGHCKQGRLSIGVDVIDPQVEAIWRRLPFPASWRRRMAEILTAEHHNLVLEALFRNAGRITGRPRDHTIDTRPYAIRLAITGERAPELAPSAPAPSIREARQLFSDMSALWERAANAERRELLASLVEHVYVNLDEGRITGVQPTPGFDPWGDPERKADLEWALAP